MSVPGIIVTYFPDEGFAQRLAAIARETSLLIVVDNSADDATHLRLRKLCAEHRAQLIENAENVGLGGALNQAFEQLKNETEWALAFDQDSTPEPGFVEASLLAAGATGPELEVARASRPCSHQSTGKMPVPPQSPWPAAVGANWRDEARPENLARHLRPHRDLPLCFERSPAETDLDRVTCVITSGTLFHVPTWRRLGGFDAALFLDLVDTDFCLRARAHGYDVRVAAAAKLRHRRGDKLPVQFCGITFWPAFMPETRLHYLFRNRVRLFLRHAWRFPHWAVYEVVYAAKILANVIFLEDRKAAKLAACLRGTWDGLLGRTGRLEYSQP